MNNGKKVCERLKAVRKEIADANDIPYEITECHHKGDCSGTCPKCEQEVRYIESELSKRSKMGKAASIIGIATTVLGTISLAGCNTIGGDPIPPTQGDPVVENDSTIVNDTIPEDTCQL